MYVGAAPQWAVLVFSAQAARWASHEEWHAQQQGRWLPDGSYEMRLPYVDDTELVMDLLRLGEQVRVVSPQGLQDSVKAKLAAALQSYGV